MPRKIVFFSFLLVLSVWFLYGQTGAFEFLRLDDHDYTFRCAFVHDGLSLSNVKAAFTNLTHAAIWMPLTYVSYMADISLFGPGMGAHHLVNVALHSLAAVLLFVLLLRLFPGRHGIALLAALLWALHPQRAEAVAWIAGRKEMVCAVFVLLGLLAWERGTKTGFCLGALCCLFACMGKPTAMCFPFLAFAVETASPHGGRAREWPGRIAPYLPLLLISAATGALAVYSQTHADGHGIRALFSASMPWRLLNAAVAIGLYLAQMLVPIGIHLDYRATPERFPLHGTLGLCAFALAACLAAALCIRAWLWRGAHGRPFTAFAAVLWFIAALVPTLGVFGSFGEHARADRFVYLPAMAVSILIVPLASRIANAAASRLHRRLFAAGAASIVSVYAAASFPVIASYRNDFTAFSRTLEFDPDNGRALAHVASEECARNGRIDRGISLFRKSQEVRPRDDTAAQLAYALTMRGLSSDMAEIRRLCAKFACDHSLDAKGMALEALGTTAMRQRRWAEAISCLEDSIKAPRRFYSSEDAQLRLAACYANAKRPDDAIRALMPLTQSKRSDIRGRATEALAALRRDPGAMLFF